MSSLDRPLIRPLSGRRVEHRGRAFVALEDSLGLFPPPFLIPLELFQQVVRHFDGASTLGQVQGRVLRESGRSVSIVELEALVRQLDVALVLDGPSFASYGDRYSRMDTRIPAHAGRSYPASPTALRAELDRYFAHPDGSGPPSYPGRSNSARLRAILCPHIDFGRGGPVYSWAYRELLERSDADTFVILGVAHQHCRHRFALTRKDFQTPLGMPRTDRSFVDFLAKAAGLDLFEDELAHRTEHSIEFQVVFLQHLLGDRRDFSIVPILVGSFHDLMMSGADPIDDPEVGRMVEALRLAEASSGRRVAYIGGIDLCHVGPEFGDPNPVDDATLDEVRKFDEAMLDRASRGDARGWFGKAAEIDNRWRVCGLAATYTLLQAIGPAEGRLLRYDQSVNSTRTCCVTFASVAYEATGPATIPTHD
jgi:AmmeMemoRadiSam system protein B